ncbi:MAG TPA: hypothetical protein PLK76_01000 [bacterium]|nr:hypothetical protein [bacterium]
MKRFSWLVLVLGCLNFNCSWLEFFKQTTDKAVIIVEESDFVQDKSSRLVLIGNKYKFLELDLKIERGALVSGFDFIIKGTGAEAVEFVTVGGQVIYPRNNMVEFKKLNIKSGKIIFFITFKQEPLFSGTNLRFCLQTVYKKNTAGKLKKYNSNITSQTMILVNGFPLIESEKNFSKIDAGKLKTDELVVGVNEKGGEIYLKEIIWACKVTGAELLDVFLSDGFSKIRDERYHKNQASADTFRFNFNLAQRQMVIWPRQVKKFYLEIKIDWYNKVEIKTQPVELIWSDGRKEFSQKNLAKEQIIIFNW